uniref:Uncharacterized protein n=1 Tax=Zea mays TaxID=4577 RepID=C0PAZ7_MAIZE|nr:unknown [Zea mays]
MTSAKRRSGRNIKKWQQRIVESGKYCAESHWQYSRGLEKTPLFLSSQADSDR